LTVDTPLQSDCKKSVDVKYESSPSYGHEQFDGNVATATLDARRLDRTSYSDTNHLRNRPPFFIDWIRRPQLRFIQPIVEAEPDKTDPHKITYSILLEVENYGKHFARACNARFSVLSLTRITVPAWGVLSWIYEDGHRESQGNLSYMQKARIELLRLVVNQTKLSEEQMQYEYELDGKQVASFIGRLPVPVSQIPIASLERPKAPDKTVEYRMIQGLSTGSQRLKIILEVLPIGKFKVSIYGDDGVKKFGQVRVVFGSDPKVDPIVDL
jgi:hypothetical protein